MQESPPRKARKRSGCLGAVLIAAGLGVFLYRANCSPIDITDDPTKNGGYTRGAIFTLKVPVHVGNGYAQRDEQTHRNGDVEIPAGTRVVITRVTWVRTFEADNIRPSHPIGRFLDGPMAGTTVELQSISKETAGRSVEIDPEMLSGESGGAARASAPTAPAP